MKKTLSIFFILFTLLISIYAQSNNTVEINDDVYELLRTCEIQNLCEPLNNVRPYSVNYVKYKLEEILSNLDEETDSLQISIVQRYIEKYKIESGVDLKNLTYKYENNSEIFPVSFVVNDSFTVNFSTGMYADTSINSYGYEVYDHLNFLGDFGKNVSYDVSGLLGLTEMPLEYMGEYNIGEWLYDDFDTQPPRTINSYRNNSFLPYHYSKYWDGSVYFLSNLTASGLETWPSTKAIGLAMLADIHGSFFDNKLELSLGRKQREWAAMDNGSSLVLNAKARPFMAFEADAHLFPWLSFSTITGVLENPNQAHINMNAWYDLECDENGELINDYDDSYFFQNAFSMGMLALDFKYFHFDFGSTCVWPKRFELGYGFPLLDRVVYQNNIGDFDNLSLFVDLKGIYPGVGSIWISGYLDEISLNVKTKFWEKTRAMYAMQTGTKVNVPFIPFTTASLRYTKVEPYCYTHHSINYTPWYNHYLSESYTNNGESLGYYLPPNSDEINFEITSKAIEFATLSFQYQLIRHGTDWGSGAVPGSSLYSEMRNYNRDDLNKYFLHDGTYEWSNIISVYGSYDFRKYNLPVKVFMNIGFIYDWFTEINGEPGWGTGYSHINNSEYSDKVGFVVNIGFSVFQR